MGVSLGALGKQQEGLGYDQQALAMYQRLYPDQDHPDIALSLNNVGVSLGALGKQQEGLGYDQQALAMALCVYRQEHPHITRYLNNLIRTLRNLADPALLQPTQAEILPLCTQWLGEDHALTQQLQNLSL